MKRHKTLIALLTVLIALICSETIAVYLPGDIRPADAYSDPADYELILMDRDTWELRMNQISDTGYVKQFSGILLYGYGSTRYKGNLEAIYYENQEIMLVTCTDPGWNNNTLSYALHFDASRPNYYFRLVGTYLCFEEAAGNLIYADIVKGTLGGDHVPYHG